MSIFLEDFAEYINAKSIEVNREYASYIYTKTVTETRTTTYINPNIFVTFTLVVTVLVKPPPKITFHNHESGLLPKTSSFDSSLSFIITIAILLPFCCLKSTTYKI